jgi:exosortase
MMVESIRLSQLRTVQTGAALLAGLVCLAVFSGPLTNLTHRWIAQEEYSHGFLIPIVATWLLWRRRDVVLASIGKPSWIGPGLILLALSMHVIGELSALFIFSQLGFVMALAGIALSAGGYSLLCATFVPIVFLLFAIPLPYFIDAALTLQLQFISS